MKILRVTALLLSLLCIPVWALCACGRETEIPETESTANTGKTETEEQAVINTSIERPKDLSYIISQKYRPRIHFSCEKNGMNDPNGLWYDEIKDIYHLYFQYNPEGIHAAANCVWGHAVSKDLVNWIELEPALGYQSVNGKSLGIVASGSCVVDEDNTSGLFDESIDPKQRVVAVYTNFVPENVRIKQVQSVAYSLDGGYSFIHYENNPVIPEGYNKEADFRDPKVIKYYDKNFKNGYIWLMVVAGGIHQLYTSEDLIHWTFNSAVTDPFSGSLVRSECPDLFPLSEEGNEENTKWILSHSGSYCMIGEIVKNKDGLLEFKGEAPFKRFTTPNTAAFQSFYNTADGRRVGLAWQADFSAGYEKGFEDKVWNGCHTVAMELTLRKNSSGKLAVFSFPVKETEAMRGKSLISLKDTVFDRDGKDPLEGIASKHFELETSIDVSKSGRVTLKLREGNGQAVYIHIKKQNEKEAELKAVFNKSSSLMLPYEKTYSQNISLKDGTVSLRIYCDGMAFELYANGGEMMLENIIFPEDSSDKMSLSAEGSAVIKSLDIWELKSIFED